MPAAQRCAMITPFLEPENLIAVFGVLFMRITIQRPL